MIIAKLPIQFLYRYTMNLDNLNGSVRPTTHSNQNHMDSLPEHRLDRQIKREMQVYITQVV